MAYTPPLPEVRPDPRANFGGPYPEAALRALLAIKPDQGDDDKDRHDDGHHDDEGGPHKQVGARITRATRRRTCLAIPGLGARLRRLGLSDIASQFSTAAVHTLCRRRNRPVTRRADRRAAVASPAVGRTARFLAPSPGLPAASPDVIHRSLWIAVDNAEISWTPGTPCPHPLWSPPEAPHRRPGRPRPVHDPSTRADACSPGRTSLVPNVHSTDDDDDLEDLIDLPRQRRATGPAPSGGLSPTDALRFVVPLGHAGVSTSTPPDRVVCRCPPRGGPARHTVPARAGDQRVECRA